MTVTRGQRISIGRASVQGTFLRSRGPLALVRLDVRAKPNTFLLSSCKPLPDNTVLRGNIIPFPK